MTFSTTTFDAAANLDTQEAEANYLTVAFETGEAETIKKAISTIIHARGMTELAKSAGVSRQELFEAFSTEGDPKLSILLGILRAFDMKLLLQKKTNGSSLNVG